MTTAKLIGDTPTLQAEPSQKERPNSNASRSSGERGLGGEALLSEKRPLPPESPSSTSIQPPLYDADDFRKKITDNRKISAGKPLKDKNKDCTKDRETNRHAQSTR